MSWGWKYFNFAELVGLTLVSVTRAEDDSELRFITDTGREFILHHHQDCCEQVYIEDITGDLEDLLNTPITLAEESSNHEDGDYYESVTWTFYKLATVRGYVDIRWCGSSNGYYSEGVDFQEVPHA